jgi:hypothetical protein
MMRIGVIVIPEIVPKMTPEAIFLGVDPPEIMALI